MLPRLAALWDQVSTSLWFIPALMTFGTALLAWAAVASSLPIGEAWWLHRGPARDASSLLSSLLNSLITISALVISITMVVLTLAARQLGPRVIRSFMGDWRTQVVIGFFVATIVYLLLVLRTLNAAMADDAVPHLAVTIGTAFVLLSVFALLFYVNLLARSIIADTVIERVGDDLEKAIRRFLPSADESHPPRESSWPTGAGGASSAVFRFETSGYVQAIDYDALASAAQDSDAYLELRFRPGQHLIRNGPHARVWPRPALKDQLADAIRKAVVLGEARSGNQDVEFAARQLVEMTLRALTSSNNDPFTAMAAIDRLAASLALMMELPEPPRSFCDQSGKIRVCAPVASFATVTEFAFTLIRQASAGQVPVNVHMLHKIAQLGEIPHRGEHAEVLARHADLILAAASDLKPTDLARLRDAHGAAIAALKGESSS